MDSEQSEKDANMLNTTDPLSPSFTDKILCFGATQRLHSSFIPSRLQSEFLFGDLSTSTDIYLKKTKSLVCWFRIDATLTRVFATSWFVAWIPGRESLMIAL